MDIVERAKMHKQLSNEMAEQALKGIIIPSCPTSLTAIMHQAKRPSSGFTTLAQLISKDAGIVGPLLKLANSPYFGLRSKVTSVFQAISVLGVQNTVNLVQNIILRQSIGGKSQKFEKFWERSSLTATIAEKISARFLNISRNDAYIAGLFHDCGIPVLMNKFPEYRETVMALCQDGKSICEVENDTFFTTHAVVGNMLTRSWMLPEHVSKAILYHHDATIFASKGESIGADICDLIGIVHMAECIADEHLHVSDKEWHQFERVVLKHFELSGQEFAELSKDVLAHLNGDL